MPTLYTISVYTFDIGYWLALVQKDDLYGFCYVQILKSVKI